MRFVLPGLASVIMLLIALIISDRSKMICFFHSMSRNDIGVILGLFLASGALGYIFSSIYWTIYWIGPKCFFANDNRSFLKKHKDKLEIVEEPNKRSKHDAWIIVTLIWHTQIEKSKEIKGINPYVDRINDITHGLGVTFVGSFISLIIWISLHFLVIDNSSKWNFINFIIFFAWVFLIALICWDYHRIKIAHQSLIHSTITKVLQQEQEYDKNDKQEKFIIYYSKGGKDGRFNV